MWVNNMQKELKFKIISEALKNGVSITCKKYDISRTIYYRWLKRFKAEGIDGLDDKKKNFIPKNKISNRVESSILELVKTYPSYGPRALMYLLDELEYNISESAVYNVFKRNNLTSKEQRIYYSKKNKNIEATTLLPKTNELQSGECWIFWITDYGNFKNIGRIYSYNLLDVKSQIACTRLYNKISFNNFEDLLTAVALSVAASLKLQINYICLFEDRKILKQSDNVSISKFNRTLQHHGLNAKIHILKSSEALDYINSIKTKYMKSSVSFLMSKLKSDTNFSELKLNFQEYIRNYNLNNRIEYDEGTYSPIEYHNKCTDTKLILPIWAYMDRNY